MSFIFVIGASLLTALVGDGGGGFGVVGVPSGSGDGVTDVVETGVVKGVCGAPFDFLAKTCLKAMAPHLAGFVGVDSAIGEGRRN